MNCARSPFIGKAYGSRLLTRVRVLILTNAGRSATMHDALFEHSQAKTQRDATSETREVLPSEAFNKISAMHKNNPTEPIDIYGHSWGGAAAMQLWNELQEAGIPVSSVTLYDPVSRSWSRTDKPAGATGTLTNYYVPEEARNKEGLVGSFLGNLFFRGRIGVDPDAAARAGGAWGEVTGATNIPVTNWPGKGTGASGHWGVFDPLPPEAPPPSP